MAGYPITKMDLWPIMDCCGLPRYASFALFEKIKAQAVHFERQGTNGYEEEEKEEEKEDVESKSISFDDFSRCGQTLNGIKEREKEEGCCVILKLYTHITQKLKQTRPPK